MRVNRQFLAAAFLAVAFSLVSAGHALAQVAPGVTQSEAHTATVTGDVRRADGTPIAGADVKLIGPAVLTTKSDASGGFIFTAVPWGTYTITVTSSLGSASRANVAVSGDIQVAIQYEPTSNLQTIAHVSTASAGAHINVTTASIYSVAPSDYAFQGNATWTQMLNQIPGVLVNGDLQGGEQISDWLVGSPITPQVPSINGALAYETSVTLDGMPLESQTTIGNPGAGFDMAGLPPAAFDTADIVRGPGANSPSIVDSLGGSLVLHAPGDIQQDSAEFSISNDPWGGIVSNLRVEGRIGRLSAMLIYGINDSPGAYGTASVIPIGQPPVQINGQTVLPIESSVFCHTGPHTGSITYFYNYCGLSEPLLFCCTQYSSEWSQHNGAVMLAYDVSPNVKAQVFYVGTQSNLNGDPFGLHLNDFVPGPGYTGSLPPGFSNIMELNPYYLYQHSSMLEEKLSIFVPGGGVVHLAAVQNNSGSFANHIYPNCIPNGVYTVYGTATQYPSFTPETFNGQREVLTFPNLYLTEQFGSHNRDQLASYDTQVGSSMHFGVSFAKTYYDTYDFVPEKYSSPFGAFNLIACNVNPANSSTLTEYRFNAGGDIGNNITLDGSWYFARDDFHTQTLEQVASSPWRDAIFNYTAPRLGLTWRPSSNISYRASAGGGFAVPSLGQLASQAPATAANCVSNICSTTKANFGLQPEKSFAFDVGTDMRVRRDTTLSFDVYRANLFGQFFTSNTTGSYSGPGCSIPACPLYISQTKNLAESRYEGINLSIRHAPFYRGIYWNANIGFIRAYIVNLPADFYNGPTLFASCPTGHANQCVNTELIPGINFNGATQSGVSPVPYAQGFATVGYQWSPRTFIDLAPTYYGNGNAYFEPAFVEFDMHAGYPIGPYVTLYATFRNITNKYGQSFATIGVPNLTAPAAIGYPFGEWGIPYGPRSLIVTANFKT
jgi:outer membrane receptor protein involved in Fe transport